MMKLKRIFTKKINSITLAAFLVAVSSTASRLLGIVRDRILAGEFGAGDTLDMYYAAFRVPDLVFNLIVLGALSAGFIPVFTGLIKDKKEEKNSKAWGLANNLLNIMFLVLSGLGVLGFVFAPQLMKLVTPGFDPEKMQTTVALTRIMFLSPILLGVSSVLGGILQSFKRFFVYSLSPIFYNLGIIFGAIYLVPSFGVYGLAWGVIIGSALHALVQLPAVVGLGWRWRPRLAFRSKPIRAIYKMMTARSLSLAINQINLLVITVIASTLISGSVAVFNLANNLQSFPIGVFGISFAIAVFPTLSIHAFSKKKLVKYFSQTFRQIMFFIVPSTVVILLLRAQIVRLVLGTGSFDWADTIRTMDTLAMFAISFFAQATIPLLIRVFYARHDSKTPFFIGLTAVGINVVLAWLLSDRLGVLGLALSFTISSIVNFILLAIVLKMEIGWLDEKRIFRSTAKFSIAALAAAIVIQAMKHLAAEYIDMERTWGVLTQTLSAVIMGAVVYLGVLALLRSSEFNYFWRAVKYRLPWTKAKPGDQGEARGI